MPISPKEIIANEVFRETYIQSSAIDISLQQEIVAGKRSVLVSLKIPGGNREGLSDLQKAVNEKLQTSLAEVVRKYEDNWTVSPDRLDFIPGIGASQYDMFCDVTFTPKI